MSKGMDNYGFQSEQIRGNKSTISRFEIFKKTFGSVTKEITEKRHAEKQLQRKEIQGNGKYTMDGSNDRINGVEYRGNNEKLYPTKEDRQSYHYGYTVHGGRRLTAVVEALIKEEKYEEVSLIAERDFAHGLKKEDLGMVGNVSMYSEAYDLASSKGKTR